MTRGPDCSICTHPERDAIDALLVDGLTLAKIAVKFNVDKQALGRHNKAHMGGTLVELRKERQEGTALSRLEELYGRTNRLLVQAEQAGNGGQALQAIREARTTLESIAKITGELNERPTLTINLAASPEWLQLQTLILTALAPFPQARLAVAEAIDVVGEIEP